MKRIEEIEEMKKQMQGLESEKKLYVEVVQNSELVNVWKDEQNNIIYLLGLLYSITINKSKAYKVNYKYNYTDLQTIKITNTYENCDGTTTKTSYIFHNVPTSMAYLDTYKLNKIITGDEN